MTTELDRLIEAVEAGTPDNFGAVKPGHPMMRGYAESAYHGSLDAAVSLLQALLPGWGWARLNDRMAVELNGSIYSARGPSPSRALLLATLRAYRSTKEGG